MHYAFLLRLSRHFKCNKQVPEKHILHRCKDEISFFVRGNQLWNLIDKDIRNCPFMSEFKQKNCKSKRGSVLLWIAIDLNSPCKN